MKFNKINHKKTIISDCLIPLLSKNKAALLDA